MRKHLLRERQPFGDIFNTDVMDGQGRPDFLTAKPLGSLTEYPNNGLDHGPSFADANPGADRDAHKPGPFHYAGLSPIGDR